MRRQFALLLFAVTTFGAFAQQATHVINGKTYFVYPYQQELEVQMRAFRQGVKQEEILHRDSLNRAIVSAEIKPVKRFIKYTAKGHNRKMLETIRREHPGILVDFSLPLEQDIVPTLEPLPDGQYVQFYRDLPYVDAENILRYKNDVVAAIFTLKNNQLNGYAYWLTSLGDTVKAGNFINGLKEGPWSYREYHFNSYDPKKPKEKARIEKYLDGSYKDTSFIHAVYHNGLLDGPFSRGENDFISEKGHYKNGDVSGEWHHYGYKIIRQGFKTIYTDEPILLRHYFLPEKEIAVKSPIIRNMIIDMRDVNRVDYNIQNEYYDPFCRYYKLHEEKEEEGLELPEEKLNSYPGEGYNPNMIYGDYGPATIGGLDFSYSRYDRKFSVRDKEYTRNDLIDSVGYVLEYDKLYEEFYPNGQLKLRFEIENGKVVSEDTVFWDNGTPLNVVNHLASGEYEEKVFDFDGKLIYNLLYDTKGNFKKVLNEPIARNKHFINGKKYKAFEYDSFFEYDNYDTLDHVLTNPEMLYETLWRFDSTAAVTNHFDPATRTLELKSYALNKELKLHMVTQFGEEYENVMSTEIYHAGDLVAKTILNGSYVKPRYRYEFYQESDTVPNQRAKYWMRSFDLQSDYTLYHGEQPFSGTFSMVANKKHFQLKSSDHAITLHYSNSSKHGDDVQRALKLYKKKRKTTALAAFINSPVVYSSQVSENLLSNLVPFSGYVFDPVDPNFFIKSSGEYYYDNYKKKPKRVGEKQAHSFDKTVEGQFLNGKPEGTWTTRNQHGEITAVVPFVNGEADGEVLYYATAYPPEKDDIEYDMYGLINPLLRDSLPAKPVRYLAKICHYKNGILNGPFYEMDWMGDTLTKWNYKDGRLEGPSLERTKIAYTTANYEDGSTDGITQTFLTLPGKDTVLLFDLNYQNGMLQGESKSYHLNGKMAKHGFFLTGQPIDDFEAYDTLGFRYQYVKFLYNQPVEEKIWEENQLSVRYEFDWRDSIYFNTRDIAGSTSLDQMLYQLGLQGDGYNEPYYGRPSLVDKTDIDYKMTKYYPNDTVARQGEISSGKKVGCWMFYSYEGKKLYEVDYADTILQINDSVRFKSKGILTLVDQNEQPICRSYIVEKIEKYDCSHTDHHEIRMLYTFWERDTSEHRINGYVKNYYDNGVLMNEGRVKNGLATGVWKFYDPYGSLNMVGEYVLGKRQGRWLTGDLSKVKYMGDICLNPNLPNLDEIMSYQEKLLDISVIYYQMTKVKKREYYGVNLNAEGPPENYFGEDGMYHDGEMYYDYENYEH